MNLERVNEIIDSYGADRRAAWPSCRTFSESTTTCRARRWSWWRNG